jgi:hypothetical protein
LLIISLIADELDNYTTNLKKLKFLMGWNKGEHIGGWTTRHELDGRDLEGILLDWCRFLIGGGVVRSVWWSRSCTRAKVRHLIYMFFTRCGTDFYKWILCIFFIYLLVTSPSLIQPSSRTWLFFVAHALFFMWISKPIVGANRLQLRCRQLHAYMPGETCTYLFLRGFQSTWNLIENVCAHNPFSR